MKKIFFNGVLLTVMCLGALGIQKKVMADDSQLSGLMLENVEALSQKDNQGVVITCGKRGHYGPCWRKGTEMKYCGEYTYYECVFTGYMSDSCYHPC